MENMTTIRPVYLKSNQGLANALQVALKNCKNELIARMDSDDVSQRYRFEKQLNYLKNHPEVDIVGGNITEFVGTEDNITGQRYVPETDEEIKTYMKKRCAFNHMSVMYKKSAVKKAGGYREWFRNEDYYLWIRMMLSGSTFANIQENIVNVRVGKEMSARRGGKPYFNSEKKIQNYMLEKGLIRYPRYLYNVIIRFVGEVIFPNSLRAKMFRLTRKKVNATKMIWEEKETTEDERKGNVQDFPPFSVAMSVYGKDNPLWFERAMESLINQTVKPDEIVLVVDGPVPPEIEAVIEKYIDICNRGGGNKTYYNSAEHESRTWDRQTEGIRTL